ncbi:hypothetical protein BDN72DRAFT_860046 [Pluteus cervinus]|uniref:Uncharacterized protein n=1 Tax=Pluteus cervinus TaxID=181527 RepID=A0ACD3AKX6_9AGAR|nr:hypothetical protein BDN72DRAFT_860046 [Pluteus cervinus]
MEPSAWGVVVIEVYGRGGRTTLYEVKVEGKRSSNRTKDEEDDDDAKRPNQTKGVGKRKGEHIDIRKKRRPRASNGEEAKGDRDRRRREAQQQKTIVGNPKGRQARRR